MRRLVYYAEITLLIMVVWIILNEKLGLYQVLSGFVIGTLSIAFTNHYILLGDYKYTYQVPFTLMCKYLFYLILQIYTSGMLSIFRMLQGNTNVGIIEFETELENELYICMLANAITLTPGTVTLDKSGRWLKILCLNYTEGETNGASVKSNFEQILMGR